MVAKWELANAALSFSLSEAAPKITLRTGPFHGIGSREGKTASQHFVKRDTEGVEIAPGIDGIFFYIHSSGLLGGDIGKRPDDELRRLGSLALAWKPRSDTKPPQPALASGGGSQEHWPA